ncbi:MAG: radical SAM protein [Caldilineaceae bacterium]
MSDQLTKLYVEITTACNLDCIMCIRRAWHEPIGTMPRATFAALIDQLAALPAPPTIHLSGYGEPMSHRHFLDFVRMAKGIGAKVEATTNGTLLDEKMANALLDLDLDRLVVSLDGASPARFEEIRARASYQQVINNLFTLKRLRMQRTGRAGGRHANPQLAIAFVAMRENVADMDKLPRLANQLGAWEILISNLVPHTAELEQEILYSRSLTACAYRASRWVPALSLPKLDFNADTAGPIQGVFNTTASVSMAGASLSARNDYCRFAQEGYAALRWDGEVSPCLSLLHDHPEYIRGRRKDVTHHSFGNINQRPLDEIWNSQSFATFREELRTFHFSPCTTCGGCERFPYNFEDCTGNGFPTCGGCLWAQGFVQCA